MKISTSLKSIVRVAQLTKRKAFHPFIVPQPTSGPSHDLGCHRGGRCVPIFPLIEWVLIQPAQLDVRQSGSEQITLHRVREDCKRFSHRRHDIHPDDSSHLISCHSEAHSDCWQVADFKTFRHRVAKWHSLSRTSRNLCVYFSLLATIIVTESSPLRQGSLGCFKFINSSLASSKQLSKLEPRLFYEVKSQRE